MRPALRASKPIDNHPLITLSAATGRDQSQCGTGSVDDSWAWDQPSSRFPAILQAAENTPVAVVRSTSTRGQLGEAAFALGPGTGQRWGQPFARVRATCEGWAGA